MFSLAVSGPLVSKTNRNPLAQILIRYLGYPVLTLLCDMLLTLGFPGFPWQLFFLQSGTVSPLYSSVHLADCWQPASHSAEGWGRLPKYELWPGWVIKPVGLRSLTNPQVIPVLLLQAYRYLTPYTPICIAKAVKNASETEGMRRAHVSEALRASLHV